MTCPTDISRKGTVMAREISAYGARIAAESIQLASRAVAHLPPHRRDEELAKLKMRQQELANSQLAS